MKYIYCSLAIGQKYFNSARQFSIDLYNKNIDFTRVIVSDILDDSIPNTIIIPPPTNVVLSVCNAFNYNLKYLAFKAVKENISTRYEYIIYTDADWRIRAEYEANKIQNFLNNHSTDIDIFFERPHIIGTSKYDDWGCFWKHKIQPYNLLNTNKYDSSHVPNEQFLIVKNTDKLSNFINYWSDKNSFCIDNNVWTFAEGVEIGMSYTEAEMVAQWTNFYDIHNCFEFNDVSGNLHIRF